MQWPASPVDAGPNAWQNSAWRYAVAPPKASALYGVLAPGDLIILPAPFTPGPTPLISLCNVTMQYTLGQPYTWVGALTGNSRGANLIVTSPPGAAVVGTLKQQ